jgi:hypothetical protein
MKKASIFLTLFIIITAACGEPLSAATPATSAAPTAEPVILPSETPEAATPTPEVFIALTQAVPAQVQLNGVSLAVQEASLGVCEIPNCPPVPDGTRYLRVPLQAINLPADQTLDYKNLPQGIAIADDTGTSTPFERIYTFSPTDQRLTLYFAVPQAAAVFGLQWPGSAEVPFSVSMVESPTAQPLSFEGTTISYAPLSLVLPAGLASGYSGVQYPRHDDASSPFWEQTPGHTQLNLEGYLLQGKTHPPRIIVYPAADYAEMLPVAFESIHRLDNLLYGSGGPISADQLPIMPFFNATQVFASNIQRISFQNGGGVRFLTEYDQYAAPANNQELFYNFQGLTRDGQYYIVAILPVSSLRLAETSDPAAPLPEGGIPYLYFTGPNADMQAYYADVTELLNGAPAQEFNPTLDQLDMLIQSLLVE